MSFPRWTRRRLLQSGLAASALPLLPDAARSADKAVAKSSSTATSRPRKLFLFLDWFHVQKGELQTVLDPDRISVEGRKLLETYERDFHKHFDQGPHGFRAVDVPFGVRVVPEVAQRSDPWLNPDQPWESNINDASVIHEEGRYRCWYRANIKGKKIQLTFNQGRGMELGGSAMAYAESTDGWNWTKPKRNLMTMEGTGETNLVTPYGHAGVVFRDEHGPAEERFKCFHFDKMPGSDPSRSESESSHPNYGLYGIVSADGYRWTKKSIPLVRYFCDTFNVAAWDPLLNKYVGYFRYHQGGRSISRSETDDFWNWPQPQPLLCPSALDAPTDDYYTNAYTTYPDDPSIRLLFPAIYHRDNDSADVRMAISRDGRSFQWVSWNPVIPLGQAGALYANPNLVHLPDGKLAMTYQAGPLTHNEVWFRSFYETYPGATGFGWATWDDGRLAGIQADHIGEFSTNSARFDGKQIQINARTTRAGSVEIELRERGKPLEGFSFADCVTFSGDAIWTNARWKGKDDLSSLKGKSLVLAIKLRSAKIFGYRYA